MLSNAKLSKSFWAEVASIACFLINRPPSVSIDKKTPIEVWSSTPGVCSNLKIFCCLAYARVDNGKLEPKSVKYGFLGYKNGVKGYKLWCPEMLFFMKLLYYEICLLMTLVTQVRRNQECRWSYRLEPSLQQCLLSLYQMSKMVLVLPNHHDHHLHHSTVLLETRKEDKLFHQRGMLRLILLVMI